MKKILFTLEKLGFTGLLTISSLLLYASVPTKVFAQEVGYFNNGRTVFYSDGNTHCGFVSGRHFTFYKKVIKVPNLGRRNPDDFGDYTGACYMPKGYFANKTNYYFSEGDGTFCKFSNKSAYLRHKARFNERVWGELDVPPGKFLESTGKCDI